MNKKVLTILGASCMALVSCAALSGCGKDKEPAAAKEDYSKAFQAVSDTIKPSTQGGEDSATYPETDYYTSSNDASALLIAKFSKLASEVCSNENFELVTTPFTSQITTLGNQTVDLKMQFQQVEEIVSFKVLITDDFDDMSYYQYINVSVDYDFDTEKLNSFTVDYLTTLGGVEAYHFTEYENEKLMWLKPTTENYATAKSNATTNKNAFLSAEATATEYDFSAEYTQAMALI